MAGWLRLYTDIAADRKLRRLPPAQRWLWVVLLTMAKESPRPGWLLLAEGVPVMEEDMADAAAVELADVRAGLQAFVAQRMIENVGGTWHLINWDKRQFASDSSTERVRRYRERKQASQSETSPERFGNGPETPPEYREQSTETEEPPQSPPMGEPEAADAAEAPDGADPVAEFHAYYCEVWRDVFPRGPQLTEGRRKKIKQRLKRFTLEQLKQACDNLHASPWHRGENPHKKPYGDIDFLIRNDETVDKWLTVVTAQTRASPFPSRLDPKRKREFEELLAEEASATKGDVLYA